MSAPRGTLIEQFGAPDKEMRAATRGWWNRLRLRIGVRIVGEKQMIAHMEAWHRMREIEKQVLRD